MMRVNKSLCILVITTIVASALAENKCPQDCAKFRPNDPQPPESGFNSAKAVSAIVNGIFTALRAKSLGDDSSSFAYIGAGIFTSIWGPTHADEKANWDKYQLDRQLNKQADYLACVMESQISELIYTTKELFDNEKLSNFNGAIAGITTYFSDKCGARNCLNASRVDPSVRNNLEYANATCVKDYKTATPDECANVVWNPNNPVKCTGYDSSGIKKPGVCGSDGKCYFTDYSFALAIKDLKDMLDVFIYSDSIQNFNAFNQLWNPLAVVAYAKGAAAYMGLAQELYFMGGVDAGDQSLKMFANRTANWLQSRVDFHTDDTVSLQTVLDASNAMENPIINWRFSCRSNDAANITSMVGCADAVANWTVSTQVCSLYDGGNGLCMCKCETDAQASACGNGMMANENSKTFPLMRTSAMDQGMVAAKVLSERNRQLFKEGDVYNLITALKLMSRLNPPMPEDAHGKYQTFIPKLDCSVSSATPMGRAFLASQGMEKQGLRYVRKAVR